MISYPDNYIHELSVDKILRILKYGAWRVDNQSITSAATNSCDSKEPDTQWITTSDNTEGVNAFSDIKFDPYVKTVLDVGGGKFDCNQQYMQYKKNIKLLVWDPYNRSATHNDLVQKEVKQYKVDAVTSMSVLNVIPEATVRLAHINTLKAALMRGGKAYFKIWSGKHPLQGTYLPAGSDTFYQANAYADRFLREIEIVFGAGNVKLDKNIPNLIVAVKLSEAHARCDDIVHIQNNSKKELALLALVREKSTQYLYARNNIFKLFSTQALFLRKMEDNLIEQSRHSDLKVQHEYDRRYGLVPYKK